MKPGLSAVDLRRLPPAQAAALRRLRVTDRQAVLGKSFLESITDWENAPPEHVLGLCFILADDPIGLTLFRRHTAQASTVSIHGLKIALPWQGRGLGHEAFRRAIEYLRSEWPDTQTLKLAVDAENTPALTIYGAYGMYDSGPIFTGPNGPEHHMVLSLQG